MKLFAIATFLFLTTAVSFGNSYDVQFNLCNPRAGWEFLDCVPFGPTECHHSCNHRPSCAQPEPRCSPDLAPGYVACYCGPRRSDSLQP